MATFGETLKRERELREITLRQVSDATKINIRYLEALEQNRFDNLPGGLFNKGFIRAYAAYIGLDAEALVTSYLQEIAGPGAGSAARGVPPGLHRPQEMPRRRASSPPGEPPPAVAITFGPPAAAAPMTSAPSPPAAGPPPAGAPQPAAATPPTFTPAPPGASPTNGDAATAGASSIIDGSPGDDRPATLPPRPASMAPPRPAPQRSAVSARSAPPARAGAQSFPGELSPAREALLRAAVSHIEEAPPARAGSRTLLFILLFVGVAGFVFLMLSLLIPRPAPPPGRRDAPASATGGAASAGGEPGEAARDAATAPPEVIAAGVGSSTDVGSPAGAARPPAAPAAPARPAPPASGKPAAAPAGAEPRAPREAALPGAAQPEAGSAPRSGGEGSADAMEVRIEAARASWVQLFCDGRESINWVMGKHETHDVRCLRIVQVSAADAGAVRLTVNGADCAALGDKGARVHGYAIRIEDFKQICPPAEDERHGQP